MHEKVMMARQIRAYIFGVHELLSEFQNLAVFQFDAACTV
jgi:hypothetical protein